ncbi:hypothetical protein IY974_07470 [Campylobacter volucris]|uniref:hypothetical protein n=1 Tax=Campylobacter volucris TaxID=1031542 RepID=UPI00189FD7CD|nr:hypothetical protein [Campylobacter volucris]MBF7046393.1 hypothetical protein [Campylobacter volucris]
MKKKKISSQVPFSFEDSSFESKEEYLEFIKNMPKIAILDKALIKKSKAQNLANKAISYIQRKTKLSYNDAKILKDILSKEYFRKIRSKNKAFAKFKKR